MRRTLRARLADLAADVDPGGLRTALALKTAAAVAASATAAWLLAEAAPRLTLPAPLAAIPWLEARFSAAQAAGDLALELPLVAAILTLNLFILVPSAGYGREFRRVAVTGVLAGLLVSAVGLAGPGSWGYGELPVSLLWVVLIVGGIYARRWGPVATKLGLLTALLGVGFVATNPTLATGFWFPAAAGIALLSALVFRFLTLRPSALDAFRVRSFDLLSDIGEALSATVREGAVEPEPMGEDGRARPVAATLRRRWQLLQRFADAAADERPHVASRFRAQLVALYRMVLALEVALDSLASMDGRTRAALLADPRLKRAVDRLAGRLASPVVIGFPSEARPDADLAALTAERLSEEGSAAPERIQAVRLVTGLRRLERALNDYFAGRSEIEPVALSTDRTAAAAKAAERAARRLALQAFVAVSITTALQFTLDLAHAYWATLTVALVLNGTVGETALRSFRRGLGTLVGVAIAIALVPFVSGKLAAELSIMAAALLLVVVTIETRYTVASAAIGFVVALGIHVLTGAGTAEMAARVYETLIGAAAALAAAFLVVPSYAAASIRQEVATLLADLSDAFDGLVSAPADAGPATVAASLGGRFAGIAERLPTIAAERTMTGRDAREILRLVALLDAVLAYLDQYEAGRPVAARATVPEPVRAAFGTLDGRLSAALSAVAALAREARANREVPPPFERAGVATAEIAAAGEGLTMRDAVAVVDHAYFGNRLGRTLNDLAPIVARLG